MVRPSTEDLSADALLRLVKVTLTKFEAKRDLAWESVKNASGIGYGDSYEDRVASNNANRLHGDYSEICDVLKEVRDVLKAKQDKRARFKK